MRRVELLRSSGVRTAFFFLALFLAAAALAGTAAFLIIRQELTDRHIHEIDQEFVFFANLYKSKDLAALIDSLNASESTVQGSDDLYALLGPGGERLAGNLPSSSSLPENGQVGARALGIEGDFNYFIRSGRIGDHTLVLGTSAEDLSEIEEVFFDGAFWAALVLAVVTLAGGVALSLRMNRRISQFQAALEKVSEGRFDVRIPQTGFGDDLDRVAYLVDNAVVRLGAAVEMNRRLSSDIAHELKTPLNRLRINVEKAVKLNRARIPLTAELDAIDGESRTIIAIFGAVLRVAQIESGARKSRFAPIDVSVVLSDVIDFYRPHAEERSVALSADFGGCALKIDGDKELLVQLFANLIENAFKHAGTRPAIDCSIATEGGAAVVTVNDNGPGIPDDQREKVFLRLYRLEKSRTTPGFGLGLTLAKAIADLHGARIELGDNRPGLSVRIAFPLAGTAIL